MALFANGVIPKPRVLSSGARNPACSESAAVLKLHRFPAEGAKLLPAVPRAR